MGDAALQSSCEQSFLRNDKSFTKGLLEVEVPSENIRSVMGGSSL